VNPTNGVADLRSLIENAIGGSGDDVITGNQAANNLKAMKLGDRCFFYHSVDQKLIVGIVEVVGEYYPDPSDESGRFGMVDLKALMPVPNPVSLAQVKEDPELNHLGLVRPSRRSVLPVDAAAGKRNCQRGGGKA
jgi:predicted RNA-binding protein with PUA-like domain